MRKKNDSVGAESGLTRFWYLRDILGPGKPLPFSYPTYWVYVRAGLLPPPDHLGRNCVVDEQYLLNAQRAIKSGTLNPQRATLPIHPDQTEPDRADVDRRLEERNRRRRERERKKREILTGELHGGAGR